MIRLDLMLLSIRANLIFLASLSVCPRAWSFAKLSGVHR